MPSHDPPVWRRPTTKPQLDGYRSRTEEAHRRTQQGWPREYTQEELDPEPTEEY